MPFPMHTVEVVDGSTLLYCDRLVLGVQRNIANGSGSTSVAVAVTFAPYSLPIDINGNGTYGVIVQPNQNCTAAVTNKTTNGFTVTLYGATISAGTFDVLVVA